MTPARVGDVVGLTYDGRAELDVGDALVTNTRRTYLVVAARRQLRGEHTGRWHLRCQVVEYADLPVGTTCHPFRWYRRPRGRR